MTLVELLTAMMISVVLIGTAFTTFWTATEAWEKSKRRTEMLRLLEGTADILTQHLRAIQPPFFQENPVFVALNDSGEESSYDTICFLSSANTRFPRELAFSDLCEVEFYIETGARGEIADEQAASDPTQGGMWMRIDPTPDDDVETGGYLVGLGEQIASLDLRFFDGYEWVEDWYYDTEVPEAIEFTIVVGDPAERENPMVLTRLVTIPMAETINAQSYDAYDVPATSESTGEPGTGETESAESSEGS